YLLEILKRIVASVDVPVTADVESGFADSDESLRGNIERLVQTGIVGINFEDTDKATGTLHPIDVQCRRIEVIRRASAQAGIPLLINARTDVYVRGIAFDSDEARLEETI